MNGTFPSDGIRNTAPQDTSLSDAEIWAHLGYEPFKNALYEALKIL